MKIFILTEGGEKFGLGHLARCVGLAQGFEIKGFSPKLIVNGDGSVKYLLKDRNYAIFDWIKKKRELFNYIKKADLLIIDSYSAKYELYKKICDRVKKAVYIDDNKRINYPAGVIVNGNIYAQEIKYSKKTNAVYLLGTKYTLLRKEFWQVGEKKLRRNVRNITIIFGGVDMRNMTLKVLGIIEKTLPALKKKIIIGRANKNLAAQRKYQDDVTDFVRSPNAREMRDVMLNSDIAISAGGQTIYELARIGVPTIAIATARNQLNNAKAWHRRGFVEYAGWCEKKDLSGSIGSLLKKLMNFEIRKKKYLIGRKEIDGRGAITLADYLIKSIRT